MLSQLNVEYPPAIPLQMPEVRSPLTEIDRRRKGGLQ